MGDRSHVLEFAFERHSVDGWISSRAEIKLIKSFRDDSFDFFLYVFALERSHCRYLNFPEVLAD